MNSGIQVHIRHIRAPAPVGANLCVRGARAWFEQYGLDFRSFLEEGLPVEVLEATQDAFAMRVCAAARAEHARMGGA